MNDIPSRAITIPLNSSPTSKHRRSLHKIHASTSSSSTRPSSESSSYSSYTRSPTTKQQYTSTVSHSTLPYHARSKSNAIGTNQGMGKQPATSSPPSRLLSLEHASPLGPSMLHSSSYKAVNLNARYGDDEPPRLICYTKQSQGFEWNDELFLPSYMLHSSRGYGRRESGKGKGVSRRRKNWDDRDNDDDDDDDDDDADEDTEMSDGSSEDGEERRGFEEERERCEVVDVFVTDEEARSMMP